MDIIDIFEGHQGLDPFTGLNRDAFKSEDDYIAAAIEQEIKFSDPAYMKARAKVIKMRREQLAKEAEAAESAAFEEAVKNCVLPRQVQAKIKEDAAKKAAAEVNSGRIGAGEMEARIRRYVDESTIAAKRQFVTNARANAKIRAQLGADR